MLSVVINGRPSPDVQDEDIHFRLPLDTDTTTHFYFDRDATTAAHAWDGSTHTYDGHTGSDFSGGPRGKAIYAAADGILAARVDGFGDQEGTANGNYIKLNHGNDRNGNPISTFYLHMTAGTPINLPLGTFIAAGTLIGGVGTSGNSTGLHLHFHLSYNGTATDPFAATGETSWWENQGSGSPATATPAHKFVVGDAVTVFALAAGDTLNIRSPDPTSPSIGGQPNGATGTVIGAAALSYTGGDYTNQVYTRYKIQFANGMIGWAAQNWLRKTLPQEISVAQGATAITDGQAGAINFGSVEINKPGPTRVFTVTNSGELPLTLGAISLPAGFTLIEGLSSSIAGGASDTFTVRLDSATVGAKSGQISFSTNDANENPFNFPIQGTVSADATAPTVDVVDVTPDPMNSPLTSITIVFSEAVVGFDLNDLAFTRNGGAIALTAAQTLTTSDNITFTLSNLGPLSAASGTYTLSVLTGGVTDQNSNALATGASDSVKVQTSLFRGDATGTTADTYYLRRSTDGTQVEVFENTPPGPVPTYVLAWAGLSSLTFDTGGGDNTVTVDYTRGDPIPAGANAFQYLAGAGNNALNLTGAGTFNSAADAAATTPNLSLTSAGTNVAFAVSQHLASLTLHGGVATLGGSGKALVAKAILIDAGGQLDIAANSIVVNYAPGASPLGTWTGAAYTDVTGLLASGAIASSTASPNVTRLAVAESGAVLGLTGGMTALWANETVDASCVLVKYTYGGDANLDGKINVDDYTRIDFQIALGTTGYVNGDFNLDGKINVDDYTIIDFNVGIQGSPFASASKIDGALGTQTWMTRPTLRVVFSSTDAHSDDELVDSIVGSERQPLI